MNAPKEPDFYFPQKWHGISHTPPTRTHYVFKEVSKTIQSPLQCFFNTDNEGRNQTQEYFNFLHTQCDIDNKIYLSDRLSIISINHLFNGTIIHWCYNKQYKTSRSISNKETRVSYQIWTKNVFISIGHPIVPPSKLY